MALNVVAPLLHDSTHTVSSYSNARCACAKKKLLFKHTEHISAAHNKNKYTSDCREKESILSAIMKVN